MNRDNFSDSIISVLEPKSITVMDNVPYHSVEVGKYPNSSWKMADILEWLISKNVALDQPMYCPNFWLKHVN